jgi:hypothetical protein
LIVPDQISKENHPGHHLFIGKPKINSPDYSGNPFPDFSAGKDCPKDSFGEAESGYDL